MQAAQDDGQETASASNDARSPNKRPAISEPMNESQALQDRISKLEEVIKRHDEILRAALELSRDVEDLKQKWVSSKLETKRLQAKFNASLIVERLASMMTVGFRYMLPPAYPAPPAYSPWLTLLL